MKRVLKMLLTTLVCIVLVVIIIFLRRELRKAEEESKVVRILNNSITDTVESGNKVAVSNELSYEELAKDLTFIAISKSKGYDDFLQKYESMFSEEGLSQVERQFELYWSGDDYELTPEELTSANENGEFPVYKEDGSINRWLSKEEYKQYKQNTSYDYEVNLKFQDDSMLVYEVTIDESLQRCVTLDLNKEGLICKFEDKIW